eukprot:3086735-Rhodomonas_salina.2
MTSPRTLQSSGLPRRRVLSIVDSPSRGGGKGWEEDVECATAGTVVTWTGTKSGKAGKRVSLRSATSIQLLVLVVEISMAISTTTFRVGILNPNGTNSTD